MNRLHDNPKPKYFSFGAIVVFLFTTSLLFAQESMQEERPNFIVIFCGAILWFALITEPVWQGLKEKGVVRHYYHRGLLFDSELNPEEQFSFTRDQPEIVEKMVERLEKGRQELEVLGNQ